MPVVRVSEELFQEIQRYAEPLIDNFESALWKILRLAGSRATKPPTPSKSGDHMPPRDFWRPILEVLRENSGQADVETIIKALEIKIKDQLRPGDYESNVDGSLKWERQAHFQRLAMKHEGLIAGNSPRGVWEITNQGREWVSKQSPKLQNSPGEDTFETDPKEKDPTVKATIEKAREEAERNLANHPKRLGFCHKLWAEQKRILREKYGINWKSPAEMNPGINFD